MSKYSKRNKQKLNFAVCDVPAIIKDTVDTRWKNTIYNHYNDPMDLMRALNESHNHENVQGEKAQGLLKDGQEAYANIDKYDITYDRQYEDIARKVRDKLLARGFTTKMLYGDVSFTNQKTGSLSKQRALLGKRDCYYKDAKMSDGKIFHDIVINLSYNFGVSDGKIKRNAYALYALTKELGRLIAMRVIVVNHVGTDTPTCYSYILKKFAQPIKPKEFLFFVGEFKRTYGWYTYALLNKDNDSSTVGRPANTVSIANFNLGTEIDSIWEYYRAKKA